MDIEKLRPACACVGAENLVKTPADNKMFIKCSACGTLSIEAIKMPIAISELCALIEKINAA